MGIMLKKLYLQSASKFVNNRSNGLQVIGISDNSMTMNPTLTQT